MNPYNPIKLIIAKNHANLYKRAVKIENLPPDDDWVKDDVWDEVYQQEVIKKKEQITLPIQNK